MKWIFAWLICFFAIGFFNYAILAFVLWDLAWVVLTGDGGAALRFIYIALTLGGTEYTYALVSKELDNSETN